MGFNLVSNYHYLIKRKINMKKIYKLLALSLLLIATTSCGDEWLNTVPSDSVPADDAITTYKAASVALTGVYDGLQGASNASDL